MKTVLITGSAGLVGSECSKLFATVKGGADIIEGWNVIAIDNFFRGKTFGKEADTAENAVILKEQYGIETINIDFADDAIIDYIKQADAIIHNASQPSHPKSVEIPLKDFTTNTAKTLMLLEYVRKYNPKAVFVFSSTNKCYGEAPNYYGYRKVGKRYEPIDKQIWDGFDEKTRTDAILHTPFGVSKLSADMYVQEYAKLYKLRTGIFRMGCISGGMSKASEYQNWIPFFIKKALTGEKLSIYGHEGYQVRDIIHASDLAVLYLQFINSADIDKIAGEVYNIGGGRANSISLLEAIDLIEEITGRRINYEFAPERDADHQWWITNMNKIKNAFPLWGITKDLWAIFQDIYWSLGNRK